MFETILAIQRGQGQGPRAQRLGEMNVKRWYKKARGSILMLYNYTRLYSESIANIQYRISKQLDTGCNDTQFSEYNNEVSVKRVYA